jgi:aminoglycoside phosphotransferase (APT) family kinase protein
MHPNEVAITIPLIQQLLREQFPHLSELPITQVTSMGTDNAIYRIGDEFCARLPRIPSAAESVQKEQIWLPQFEKVLPMRIPTLHASGSPSKNYPFPFSIYNWFEGENAFETQNFDHHYAAKDLAKFLNSLQNIYTQNAPLSRRGGPLLTQDLEVQKAIKSLADVIDVDKVTKIWESCLRAPKWNRPPVWIHSDLLPANLLIQERKLKSVIDFGMMGIGDPACDLLPAWSLFTSETREVFRSEVKVDDATWLRGLGWALSVALIIIPYYQGGKNPGLVAVAEGMIREVMVDW